MAGLNDEVWVIGGSAPAGTNCWVYDAASGERRDGPSLPAPRMGCIGAAVDGRVYVIGGSGAATLSLCPCLAFVPSLSWQIKYPCSRRKRTLTQKRVPFFLLQVDLELTSSTQCSASHPTRRNGEPKRPLLAGRYRRLPSLGVSLMARSMCWVEHRRGFWRTMSAAGHGMRRCLPTRKAVRLRTWLRMMALCGWPVVLLIDTRHIPKRTAVEDQNRPIFPRQSKDRYSKSTLRRKRRRRIC